MKRIALRDEWEGYDLDDIAAWAGVYRWLSLASAFPEEDHGAPLKRFFVESIRQLKEELTTFKEEHPELFWERS